MLKRSIGISLCITGLIGLSGGPAFALVNISGGTVTTTCKCGSLLPGGKTCTKLLYPNCTASLGTDKIYASDSSPEEMGIADAIPESDSADVFASTQTSEMIATFADIPSREQVPIFASIANPETQTLLAAKQTNSCTLPQFYLTESFGAGGLNRNDFSIVVLNFLQPRLVAFQCINPGGGDGGLGQPFTVSTSLLGTDILDPNQILRNGKWQSESLFEQADVCAGITPPLDACKSGWALVPGSCQVIDTLYKIETHRCTDTSSESACQNSMSPTADDIMILDCPRGVTCDYNCSIIYHQNS